MKQTPVPPATHLLTTQQQRRLRSFASLKWYEDVITFVFTFAAQTSEMLLAAGLVVSTANFLTDGNVMRSGTGLATAWAWAQAVAIDSSLGVTFYQVFASAKRQDWIKATCYGILTLLLAIVAGTITNIDTFSHAIHMSIGSAIIQVGLDVKVLTTLRAIAVVGFVLMSRMKEVSLKDLYEEPPAAPAAPPQETLPPEMVQYMSMLARRLAAEAHAEMRRSITVEEAPQATLSAPQGPLKAQPQELAEEIPEERDPRIALAYQELVAEGKRISGRALALRAHVRRTTCNHWLAVHHPEISIEETEEEARQDQL